jgi:YVTN family beta-propeller protein
VLWSQSFSGCSHPDRLTVTLDGRAIYVPCKESDKVFVIDAETKQVLARLDVPDRPHNTFLGESGRYVYLSARSNPTMYLADSATHTIIKRVPGFSSPIRPFSVERREKYFFANLTETLGFGVGDIDGGRVLMEIEQMTPAERLAHPEADSGRPHGSSPYSHGIAVRPGTTEVWFLDDAWGYLYVYDFGALPERPRHLASVPLFERIDEKWNTLHWRWVAFSIDGRYCYPSNGSVVDAALRRVIEPRVSPSEKLIEIDFQGGRPVRVSGQNGGVYPP